LLDKILASKEEFLARAKKYSEIPELSAAEKELVYYYFLIKHFIAEHETRAIEIPLQVFSEHRMALDHFIRAKISNKDGNIDKAIGHLRRALLDSIKINSSKLKKEIEKRHEAIPKKSLGLISNGEYIKSFIKWQQQAEGMLNDARCEEYRLGNKVDENIDVVNLFIKAFLAHREWHKFQAENMGNTLYISATYYTIKGWTLLITSILSFFVGYASNFVYDNSFAKLIEKILSFLGVH
jgi:tetratricopeptide (TPR) repeat protein